MKVCLTCKIEKQIDNFYLDKRNNKHHSTCRECNARKKQEMRQKDPEKHKLYQKNYNSHNREKKNEYMRKYRKENPEIIHLVNQKQYYEKGGKDKKRKRDKENLHKTRERDRIRYKADPQYRMKKVLRSRIAKFIKEKYVHSHELLDCDINFYIEYLEYQFDDKMCWDNYGIYWNIDHVIPCSSFDLTNIDEQKKCYHWSNTRPLLKTENEKKNDVIDKTVINNHILLLKQISEENQLAIPNYSRKGIMAQISALGYGNNSLG